MPLYEYSCHGCGATFEAPPRTVGTFDLEMPGVERFSDVPIEDVPIEDEVR